MSDLFKIKMVYSTSHMLFPKIIIGILVILGSILLIQKIMKIVKSKEKISFKGKKFFEEDYDKLKFWGAIVLLAVYIFILDKIGFIASSIICIFLFNLLFTGTLKKKPMIISAVISVVTTMSIWYVFGVLFNITLP